MRSNESRIAVAIASSQYREAALSQICVVGRKGPASALIVRGLAANPRLPSLCHHRKRGHCLVHRRMATRPKEI